MSTRMPSVFKEELVSRIKAAIETHVLSQFGSDTEAISLEMADHKGSFQFYLKDGILRYYFPCIAAMTDNVIVDSPNNLFGIGAFPFSPDKKDECFDKVVTRFIACFPKDNRFSFNAIDEYGFECHYVYRTKK